MSNRFDVSLLPKKPDLSLETVLWNAGLKYIAGIDEAGRGSLAGPVAAAAVILPCDSSGLARFNGIQDSKKLSPRERGDWASYLRKTALSWAVGFASPEEIDYLGIVPATRLAAQRALAALTVLPQHLLLDYLFLPESPLPQTALIKGDARSISIASASIFAKTIRDALLLDLDAQHPGYGFAIHKGYGTPFHLKALADLGPCPIHRLSFAPLKNRGQ